MQFVDTTRHKTRWAASVLALGLLFTALTIDCQAQIRTQFEVHFTKLVSHTPVDGSVYLLISRKEIGEPRESLRNGPFDGIVLRRDVQNLRASEALIFDDSLPGYPTGLRGLEPGRYAVQAILDINKTASEFTIADGNGRSGTERIELGAPGNVTIEIDELITQPRQEDVGRVRYRYIESRIVGRQVGSRVFMQTAVMMPLNYKPEEHRTYPVQYWIPGIGEDTRAALKYFQKRGVYLPPFGSEGDFCKDFIVVLLQPNAGRGFHGFLDSAGHGAFREALFTEVIPAIEADFPVATDGSGRYLVGKGAGGLAALRLQAENPDFFAGVWALAPDPVSHGDFFGLDLTREPLPNAFRTPKGRERVLVRHGGKALLSIAEQARFEAVVRSGQIFQSYNAMYAPIGPDFRPQPLFDYESGAIDPEVARAYMRHDFLRNLEANWDGRADQLRGKFHVYVGDDDDYYLHRGVTQLKLFLEGRDAASRVEILPGKSYADMDDPALHLKIQRAIVEDWQRRTSAQ